MHVLVRVPLTPVGRLILSETPRAPHCEILLLASEAVAADRQNIINCMFSIKNSK